VMLACQVLRDHHHFHDSIVDLGYEIGFGTFPCYPLFFTTSRSNTVPSTQDENVRKMMRVGMSCTSSAECTGGEQGRYPREVLVRHSCFLRRHVTCNLTCNFTWTSSSSPLFVRFSLNSKPLIVVAKFLI
jgi:hypothetical protein